MLEVVLGREADGARTAFLRDLCGKDEISVAEPRPTAASALVLGLLAEHPRSALGPGIGWNLTIADRDRLVAALYRRCFGERIESVALCSRCNARFEVGFALDDLVASHAEPRDGSELGVAGPDADGGYTHSNGARFRLPRIDDERALAGVPADLARKKLVERCRNGPESGVADEELERIIGLLSPVLDLELDARCAECGSEQRVGFDLVSFFLAALIREQPLLAAEVHRLASYYHWSFDEILALPRDQRRAQVALIEAERAALRGVA